MTKSKRLKVSWKDGDSGRLSNGRNFRLDGVRAPESYQYGGSRAKRTASGMTGRTNGSVYVKTVGKDYYGRDIVQMRNKDGSINQRMRDKGYTNKGR